MRPTSAICAPDWPPRSTRPSPHAVALAGAFFEGQALRLLPVDDYMKRLGSRLL